MKRLKLHPICSKDSEPATLSRDEISFFDNQIDFIARAVLPKEDSTPERARDDELKNRDRFEQTNDDEKEKSDESNAPKSALTKSIKNCRGDGNDY